MKNDALATRLNEITNQAKEIELKLIDALMTKKEKEELEILIKNSNDSNSTKK